MKEEMKNNEKKVKKNFYKSVRIIDDIPDILNQYRQRKEFKKKTLRRITLDPPDELGIEEHELEKTIQKPDELSKSIIFDKIHNTTSKSMMFASEKKIPQHKKLSSLSTNKKLFTEEKNENNEDKKKIESFEPKKIIFDEKSENDNENKKNNDIIFSIKDEIEKIEKIKNNNNENNNEKNNENIFIGFESDIEQEENKEKLKDNEINNNKDININDEIKKEKLDNLDINKEKKDEEENKNH